MATVLVIDDEWAVRETVRILLEHEGFSVITAENGRIGLQRFAKHQPNIVLTDLLMPGTSGFEVIREIRQRSKQTRIIAMSGGDLGLDLLEMAQNCGTAAVIRKPFCRRDILAAAGLCPSAERRALSTILQLGSGEGESSTRPSS